MPKYVSGDWVTRTTVTNSDRFERNHQRLQQRIQNLQNRMSSGNRFDLNTELENLHNMFEKDFETTFEDFEKQFDDKFNNSMWAELQKVKKPKKEKTVEPPDVYYGGGGRNTKSESKDTKRKVETVNQFMTLDIGSNKATIDLSKVRKQGLLFEKSMFGKKPKIVIYYNDRPDTPEVNFELNSEDEARKVYDKINTKLEAWADASNSANIARLEKELEVMREQKQAMLEEKEVLMSVFNSFKEMMQIMEDDNKTSSLVATIKDL